MLIESFVASFEKGDLEIECPRMIVVQDATESPIRYMGSGLIRQANRRLEFRLFCADGSVNRGKLFFPEGDVAPGKLLPDHSYYTLTATDLDGRHWISHRIRLDRNNGGSAGVVVGGELDRIASTSDALISGQFLSLTYATDLELPWTHVTRSEQEVLGKVISHSRLDAANISASNCNLKLHKTDDGFVVEVVASRGCHLPPRLQMRVSEALEFITARSLRWSVLKALSEGKEETCLRPVPRQRKCTLDPPLVRNRFKNREATWKLFEAYLAHVSKLDADEVHPISGWLSFLRDAAGGSIYSQGLALGVVIEGVLEQQFENVWSPSPDFGQEIESLRSHIAQWGGDPALRNRAAGAVGAMSRARAKDRMHALKEKGVITKEHIEAWNQLRNSAAHARPPEDKDVQRWLDLCHTAEVMLYRLIFEAIGYSGEYTDYSADRWPDVPYIRSIARSK